MYALKTTEKGLKYIEITNDAATAKIAVQGAHIFHYEQKGKEPLLWVSSASHMEHGEHIRGGVPICWPSFGMSNPELPQHGFARNRMWDLVNLLEVDENTTVLIMELKSSKKSMRAWEYKFNLQVKFTISNELTIELTTVNLDEKTFKFTQALHTYFIISNIDNITIEGLASKPYLDALTNERKVQNGDVTIAEEVDRVYQNVDGDIVLKDGKKAIAIKAEGSSSAVVWNPWIEKAKKMKGMNPEDYKEFVCIETANAYDDYKILDTNESHTLKLTIS